MINIAIHGVLGKMGRAIARLANDSNQLKLISAFDTHANLADLSSGITKDILHTSINADALKNVQVLIDFSVPQASISAVQLCLELKIPMVIGTTGFSSQEESIIENASKKIPILKSSNMSVGVNLLFALTKMAAKSLNHRNFQVEMMEIHHGKKKDAPSGTAKTLEKILLENMPLDKNVTYGREGMVGERKQNELGSFALRGGDVVGDHTVYFLGEGERIELKHQAVNRDVFAQGALVAAEFISGKPAAFYSMAQALGLSGEVKN
ncbi:MAG: 4-hydroxy-tetrahydrodipicolinate reductase [Spirochaetia bacterium]|nr:4-hydroxy-tetrahydrodipicolinate reductase [Spirochaetia bacterium]